MLLFQFLSQILFLKFSKLFGVSSGSSVNFIVESLHSWDALKHVSFIARWEVAAWELQEGERSLPNAMLLDRC